MTQYHVYGVGNALVDMEFEEDLAAAGVNSNLTLDNRESGVTGKCIVLVTPDAERSMNTYLGITQRISTREMDEVAIKNSDFVYIEGYLAPENDARAAAIKTREVAESAGVKTALTLSDVNMVKFFKDGMNEMLGNGVDLLFCNLDEALLMTGAADIQTAVTELQKISKQFAVTLGAKGAILFDGKNTIEIPAEPVTPIDSNGAGDLYAGTFLYGLTHGMAFGDCGKMAGAAATELVQHFGARLPTESLQAIKKQFTG